MKTTKMTLTDLFEKTVKNHPQANALAMVDEKPITYQQLDEQVRSVMVYLEKLGIKPGDKLAILSHNIPNWGIAFYATVFMGAVAVPLLPDFNRAEIENILSHSEAKAVFISESLLYKSKDIQNDFLQHKILIDDFSLHESLSDVVFDPAQRLTTNFYEVKENDLASIIYTSGTTGKSKGVMLTHKNICFTAQKGAKIQPVDENDRFLSILPLSHTYENTLGLILPMLGASCVYYLGKTPSPSILLPALRKVKPTMMLTVPLIIQKIYRNKILPAFQKKWITRNLYKIPLLRKKLNRIAGKKLYNTFGGELKFFGIGGAKLDGTVERFLREAKFPYAIGYGLTETSPLLAGSNAANTVYQSTGPKLEGIELKINTPDEVTGEGEIWARGNNVMLGYYKDEELTKKTITPEGWFKTGDLGVFDEDNNLHIKGRIKNVIISSNGENIYPEEIESLINNYRYVVESLVIEQKGKLVAFVHFNREELEKRYEHLRSEVSLFVESKIEELKQDLHDYVNKKVNKFSRIQKVELQPAPFKKTATHKIKRFLYKNAL